jgi:hypothetical protein
MTIKVLHIRRPGDGDSRGQNHYGGLTLAYMWGVGDSHIDVASSKCSDQDLFVKKIGATNAIQNLLNGKSIRIPFHRNTKTNRTTPTDVVRRLFDPVYDMSYTNNSVYNGW